MKMERINIYKIKGSFIKAFIAIGFLFLILGLIILSRAIYIGFDTRFFGGHWNSIIYIFQGIVFIVMGFYQLNYRSYFIEWNENEIKYFLRGDKQIRNINISTIKSIEIKTTTVVIESYENEVVLEFDLVEYGVLKRIKDKFEELKTDIKN
jgi:hypothetical protein